MSIELNWAQKEALPAIATDLQAGHKKLYVDMPTRSGKTGIPLTMLERFAQQDILPSTTIVTDRKVLVRNIIRDAALFAPTLVKKDLIQAHTSASLRKVSTPPLVRVMTYAGRTAAVLDGTLNPDEEMFIVEDEGQHCLSDLRLDTHNRNPNAIHLALTASPEYSQEKGLPQIGYKRSYHLSRQRAIDGKLNAQTRSVIIEMENIKGSLDDISSVGGDFSPQELETLVRKTEVMENLGNIMEHYHTPVDSRPIVERSGFIYCSSIADSIATAEYLNKKFGKNTCGAAWGDMKDTDQTGVLKAHDSGKIRFLASADFAVEGHGNKKHDVAINKVASKSGVRVKQRGGRPTGFDKDNLDKEAVILDLIYPSERGEQLTFGDVEGGFLFESSNRSNKRRSERNPINIKPEPVILGLKIHSTPRAIEDFLHRRVEKRTKANNRHLENYTEDIQKRMLKTGLLSLDSLWSKVEEFLENNIDPQVRKKLWGKGKGKFGKNTIKNLMLGGLSYGDSKYRQYNGAAVALAAVLGTHPKILFGSLENSEQKSGKNPLSEIQYEEEDLVFNEGNVGIEFDKSAHYEDEEAQPLSLSNNDYSDLLNESNNSDEIEQSIDYQTSGLVESFTHEFNVRREMTKKLQTLTAREEFVVRAIFGFDTRDDNEHTVGKIAAFFDVSSTRIGGVRNKALLKLRHPSRRSILLLNSVPPRYQNHYDETARSEAQERTYKAYIKAEQEKKGDAKIRVKQKSHIGDSFRVNGQEITGEEATKIISDIKAVSKSYGKVFRNVHFATVLKALKAVLSGESKKDKLRDFMWSNGYNAQHLIRLVEKGYTWGVQDIINRPLPHKDSDEYDNEVKYKEYAVELQTLMKLYLDKKTPKPEVKAKALTP